MHNREPNYAAKTGRIDELVSELIREFGTEAALIAWGYADIEADQGHLDLARSWVSVMDAIIAMRPTTQHADRR